MSKGRIVLLLLSAIIIILGASIALLVTMQTPYEKVTYNIQVSKSIYKYPQWNITLNINENIPALKECKLIYRNRIVATQALRHRSQQTKATQ